MTKKFMPFSLPELGEEEIAEVVDSLLIDRHYRMDITTLLLNSNLGWYLNTKTGH